jgi:RNA-directed DNA polymerase
VLPERLAAHVRACVSGAAGRTVLNLIGQYLRRTAERGGVFFEHARGISLGCPLSPLMGVFFLREVDLALEASGLFHVRFMDDVLVLAPTRWRLRRAVVAVNRMLASLRPDEHPGEHLDETFIGRMEKGFEFPGYHFGPTGLRVARATIERFVDRAARLYEQQRTRPHGPSPFGAYVRRWVGWATGGVMIGDLGSMDESLKQCASAIAQFDPWLIPEGTAPTGRFNGQNNKFGYRKNIG